MELLYQDSQIVLCVKPTQLVLQKLRQRAGASL